MSESNEGRDSETVREWNCRNPSIAEEKRGDHVSKNLESWRVTSRPGLAVIYPCTAAGGAGSRGKYKYGQWITGQLTVRLGAE